MARIGAPIEASRVLQRCARKRAVVMDVMGFLIAGCLPASYRGFYASADAELAEARAIADELGKA